MKKEAKVKAKRAVIKSITACVCIILFVLTVSATIAVVTAAHTSASVSIESADTTLGSRVTLPITISCEEGIEISGAQINLTYDPTVVQVTAVGSSSFDDFCSNIVDGKVSMIGFQIGADLTTPLTFADVTIEAIGIGCSSLDIEMVELLDGGGSIVPANIINGSLVVESSDSSDSGTHGGSKGSGPSPSTSPATSPTPTPSANETIPPSPSPSPTPSQTEESGIVTVQVGDVTAERGELVNITIMIKGVGGEGLSAAQINLTYNPKVVKVISVGNSDYDMFMPNIGKGKVRMVGFQTGAEGLKGDVLFAEIQVKAVGKTNESSELKLEVKELTDNVGKELKEHEDFEVENGFFSITGEGKTEALSAAIWIWGVVGVLLLIVVIAGVRQYKRKKKRQ